MKFLTQIEKFDTREIVNSEYINWNYLKNKTVMVTGATGLIGSQIVKALLYANETLNTRIKIVAVIRNRSKAKKIFGTAKLDYICQDIANALKCKRKVDFIIHTANSTSSSSFVEKPVETIDSIVQGTKNILDFARKVESKSIVYLSSMEVYGEIPLDRLEPLLEKDYGYVDISKPRSSYQEGKRAAECLCVAYASEYNVPVKIARLSQTIGAGVDYNDNRVFAMFARNIVEKKDIVLKTKGETVRSYCYITDAVVAILKLLEQGIAGEAYNVANPETTCSIKDMAEMLCNKYKNSKLVFKLEQDNKYLGTLRYYLDTSKIEALSWKAKISLEEMFERLIKSFYSRKISINLKNNYESSFVDTVNIVLATDNNYAPHCAATMASILKNSDSKTKIQFFILDGGINDISKSKIEKLKQLKDFSITYYDMLKYDWSKFPLNRKYISIATYYRLLIAELLPKEVKKIIYLDCDIIVPANIREFWDYDIEKYSAGAIEDITGIKEAKKLGFIKNKYFNAGVLLLNVEKLRNQNFFKTCMNYFCENQKIITLQDQDILNGVWQDDVLFLPLNWNVNTRVYSRNNSKEHHLYTEEDEWNARYFPKIIHYSDKFKPWTRQCMHALKEEYYKYLKLTDFKKERRSYLFNKLISNIFAIQTNFDVYQIKLFNMPIYFVEKGAIKNIYLFGIKIFTRVKKENKV